MLCPPAERDLSAALYKPPREQVGYVSAVSARSMVYGEITRDRGGGMDGCCRLRISIYAAVPYLIASSR